MFEPQHVSVQHFTEFQHLIAEENTLQADLKLLEAEIQEAEGDIDFLLTADWPAKVMALCAPGSVPEREVSGQILLLPIRI